MKYEKSCGAVVYKADEEGTKFLLIKHINGGHWGFPKGHVEEGENEHQTALREILEETGLEVELTEGFRYRMDYSPKENVMKEVIFFLARSVQGEVNRQLCEVEDFTWLPYDDAVKLVTHENTRQLLREAYKYLNR
jgi:8-oxo-dGTP pyrophosphatase MutT (NUDIX family)